LRQIRRAQSLPFSSSWFLPPNEAIA
jgi:hypothetical protein